VPNFVPSAKLDELVLIGVCLCKLSNAARQCLSALVPLIQCKLLILRPAITYKQEVAGSSLAMPTNLGLLCG
jgi:hypothetical protein